MTFCNSVRQFTCCSVSSELKIPTNSRKSLWNEDDKFSDPFLPLILLWQRRNQKWFLSMPRPKRWPRSTFNGRSNSLRRKWIKAIGNNSPSTPHLGGRRQRPRLHQGLFSCALKIEKGSNA